MTPLHPQQSSHLGRSCSALALSLLRCSCFSTIRAPFFFKALFATVIVVLASLALPRLAAVQRAMSTAPSSPLRNVAVVGGSYVGAATAKELIDTLPSTHRVVLIEKQEHFGHLFVYPVRLFGRAGALSCYKIQLTLIWSLQRFAIARGHEHKAFIPTTLPPPHLVVRAAAESISPTSVSLDRVIELDGKTVQSIDFDALVVATGTKLTPPGTMPGESKKEGIEYLRGIQEDIKRAKKIVILGGGAVGVRKSRVRPSRKCRTSAELISRTLTEMATDLAIVYQGEKDITVVQSRTIMPRFHPLLHETCMKRFEELKIKTVLGSRAVVPEGGFAGVKEVKLEDGRVIEADFVVSDFTWMKRKSSKLNSRQRFNLPVKSPILDCSNPSPSPPSLPVASSASSLPSNSLPSPRTSRRQQGGSLPLETLPIRVREALLPCRVLQLTFSLAGAPKAARPGAVQAGVVARNIAALLSGAPSSSFEVCPALYNIRRSSSDPSLAHRPTPPTPPPSISLSV